MSNRIRVVDDGTMDIVLVCSECGEEARYNFDITESADQYGEEKAGAYDSFVDWAIEDFDREHECPIYSIQTWFERDRAHVALYFGTGHDANDKLIVEWWDEAVTEAIEDGFLNPKDFLTSAIEYAKSVGLTQKQKKG